MVNRRDKGHALFGQEYAWPAIPFSYKSMHRWKKSYEGARTRTLCSRPGDDIAIAVQLVCYIWHGLYDSIDFGHLALGISQPYLPQRTSDHWLAHPSGSPRFQKYDEV